MTSARTLIHIHEGLTKHAQSYIPSKYNHLGFISHRFNKATPETSAGHKYVLIISDCCMKWVATIALELSKHASGVAIALFKVKSNNNKSLTMFESLLPVAKNVHCRCSCKWVYLEF